MHSHLPAAQTGPGTYEVLPEQPCKLFIWRHGFATLNGTAAVVAPTPKRTASQYEESTRGKMLYVEIGLLEQEHQGKEEKEVSDF